ncbi:MAG: hypothetical protein CSA75_02445 [Sorangium cellulosum]|nr:MAG: hypothetical protein CSA75_02445 [Sorangium cellulosum]
MASGLISREQVLQVARLACLELTHAEADEMAVQLGFILDYFGVLDGVNLSAPCSTDNSEQVSNLRPDQVGESLEAEVATAQAAQANENLFVIHDSLICRHGDS